MSPILVRQLKKTEGKKILPHIDLAAASLETMPQVSPASDLLASFCLFSKCGMGMFVHLGRMYTIIVLSRPSKDLIYIRVIRA